MVLGLGFEKEKSILGKLLVNHFVHGAEFAGTSKNLADVFDPALGIATKSVRLASKADVNLAVSAAKEAFEIWSKVSTGRRNEILFRFRELLEKNKKQLAEIITEEHGKVLSDSLAEIGRGQEVVEFACGLSHLLKGEFAHNATSEVDVFSLKEPLGVVGIVSPFNFPAMVPMWFFPIAIAAGNCVILKPSEKNPSAAIWVGKLWKEAGLPDGVFNVLQGGKDVVNLLIEHPDIESISFVGSTPVAKQVYQGASKMGKRVQALGGAKNHMLVLPDSNVELAADAAVSAAYGSAGERCMAISVVVAVEPIGDELVHEIKERVIKIRVGDGRGPSEMGPLISEAHLKKVTEYIQIAEKDNAEVVIDGRTVQPHGDRNGFWLGPTLLDKVPTESRVYQEEIFGPVLSIVRAESYETALKIINSGRFGNGSAIFTRDGGAARRFVNSVESGMVGINVPIPVPVAYFSFGGWKHSLFGDSRAHGEEGFRFFTRQKVVTSRWPDHSQGGVNLGFPSS